MRHGWLNFVILNGVAPIDALHKVSDAGAGAGLMQLHPTRDAELIACGRANTLLNGVESPSPVVDTGIEGQDIVTPAILVHGVLMALQARGFKVRLHCYQLGLAATPDFTGCRLDDVVVHHCLLGAEAQLIRATLVPELLRQAATGEAHLIAESGIGGTTYATLWLRRWLNDAELWFPGSTKDPDKLDIKAQIIETLMAQTATVPIEPLVYTSSTIYSDPIQRACCALLSSELPSLWLAGGVMMFAPLIAMHGASSSEINGVMNRAIKVASLRIMTTRWVLESEHACRAANGLPKRCELKTPKVNFSDSMFEAIRMYEQGHVVEGCGLGAVLVFAEEQGICQKQLLASLDEALAPWVISH
jgi:NaMN:DMB phosphoribosyltransferase